MQRQNKIGEVVTGMAWVWTCNLLACLPFLLGAYCIFLVSAYLHEPAYHLYKFFWGIWLATNLTQLPYAIPLYRYFRRRRRLVAAKGVVLSSGLTAVGYWAFTLWFLDFLSRLS